MLALLMLNSISVNRRNARAMTPVANVEKKTDAISVCCRTCLGSDNLMSIFYCTGMENKRTEELKLVTGLEIKQNDGLSQKMCSKCIEKMNSALRFRRMSIKAEKTLLNVKLEQNQKRKSVSKVTRKTVKMVVPSGPKIRLRETLVPSGPKIILKETKPKVRQRKIIIPSGPKIIDKVEKEEFDYGCSFDDFQNDCVDESNEFIEVEVKPKVKEARAARRRAVPVVSSYKCGTCSKEFRMKATFKAHMRFHTNYCVCEVCGKRCRNNNQLQEHKRARHGLGRIHKCAYCEYSSATKEALTIHERRHTGERPYICDHCGASFHRRSNLVQHIAIHLPEKNFQCDLCPKRLKSRKFLQIHKHNAHTGKRYGYLCPLCAHRFEKPNKCTLCPNRMKSRKLLQIHMSSTHRPKRFRYICPVCRDTFSSPWHVRRHLTRTHGVPREAQTAIERYQCTLCLKREKSRKLLLIHVSKAHRKKQFRYVCPVCRDTYSRPENVRRHLARAHGVPREAQPAFARYQIPTTNESRENPLSAAAQALV